jgi:hypothetical protein
VIGRRPIKRNTNERSITVAIENIRRMIIIITGTKRANDPAGQTLQIARLLPVIILILIRQSYIL